jgi:hypothetical protein
MSAPTTTDQITTIHTFARFAQISPASTNMHSALNACDHTITLRLSKRSAITPAGTDSTIVGTAAATPTTPSHTGDGLSRCVSHPAPMKRNWRPNTRATFAIQKSR